MSKVNVQQISAHSFADFGRVVQMPSTSPTAEDKTFKFWSDIASFHVPGDTEIGLCTVFSQPGNPVTWMERHERTPELLIPIDVPFVLPVMRSESDGAPSVDAFLVDVGEAVVIGQNVWHSACHPVDADEATYFVIFRRGTPTEDVIKTDLTDISLAVT